MKEKIYIVHKGKCVLAIVLALLMLLTTVSNGNFAATVKAAKSETAVAEATESGDHKVTIFYGWGGNAGTANPATSVFKKDLNNTAYDSTAKYGLTDGDFSDNSSTSNATNRYGQKNAPAAVKSVDVLYGGLSYTFNQYSGASVYLSEDKTELNLSEGTQLIRFGGSNAWNAGVSTPVIRFYHVADDLTIVYHYADEVTLSVNAGDGASYTSNFPGYSTTNNGNVFVGYSRPREITGGFDTSINVPEGNTIDYINLQIGQKTIIIPNASVKNGTYINSSYELTDDSNNALLYYKEDKLTVYALKENISVDVNYEGVDSGKTITVIGAEGSKQAITSSDFQNYVNANGGSVDFSNGLIRLNKAYSDSTGLALAVNAAYGTVKELVIEMGEHSWTLSGDTITKTSVSYVDSNYMEAVRGDYAAGDLLKYAHTAGNKFYNFRFYEISENITITVQYESLKAEIVDEKGYFSFTQFDVVPQGSDASITDNVLNCSSRYLQRGNKTDNAYSYRAAMTPGIASLAGIHVDDGNGMYGKDFLIAETTSDTYTNEEFGTIKFAYTGGSYFARVLSQNTERIAFTPVIYGDLDRNLEINEGDLTQLRKILVGSLENTILADYDRNETVDVRDIVRMKKNVVQDIKKIVCIGDSITYGYTIQNRMDTYPSVLEGLFRDKGQNVEVINCGKSSSYVISPDKRTDGKSEQLWYPNTTEYQRSLVCGADTVVIMLGTNDCRCFTSSEVKEEFKSDLASLIRTYQGLDSVKNVYVVSSPPAYSSAIVNYAMDGRVQELQKQVAEETGARFIDLYSLIFDDITWDLTCLAGDKLHPTSTGAAMMANAIYSGITGSGYSGERAPLSESMDIYVSSVSGDNNNDGSREQPVKTLQYAFVLLRKTGGTIHIMDNQAIPAVGRLMPRNSEKITIIGENANAVLKFAGSLYLHGDVDFENVEIQATVDGLAICCNSHKVNFADNVRWTVSGCEENVQKIETTNVNLNGFQ